MKFPGLVLLAGCALTLASPARAEIVFDNYLAGSTNATGAYMAAAPFTPTADFTLSGITLAMFVSQAGTISFSVYSSAGAALGALLGTTDPVAYSTPNWQQQLLTASYSGAPLLLSAGTRYFVAAPSLATNWVTRSGSSAQAYAQFSAGDPWVMIGGTSQMMTVTGEPVAVAAVPEPASMLALGAGLLGLAGLRRRA